MDEAPSPDAGGREWVVPVAGILVVVVGVTVVGGSLFVFGSSTGCACQPPVTHAGADVDAPENGSTVTITFTSNRNADHLVVRTETTNGSVSVANTTGDAATTDEGVRLAAVGDAVTYAPADTAASGTDSPTNATDSPTNATDSPTTTTVEISVVAYPPDGSDLTPRIVASETVTLR